MRPLDIHWRGFVNSPAELDALVAQWRVSPSISDGVADVLPVSRMLFVHSYHVYEFMLTSVGWALFALEATLRECFASDDREHLERLIKRAVTEGLLTASEAQALNGARKLRNLIVHGHLLPNSNHPYTPSSAAQMLQGIHEAVSDIYERKTPATDSG